VVYGKNGMVSERIKNYTINIALSRSFITMEFTSFLNLFKRYIKHVDKIKS